MKYLLAIIFCILSINLFAKFNVEIYYDKTEDGYGIFADNQEYCPVSILLNFDLDNMKSSKGNNKIFTIDARKEKQLITELIPINKAKAYKFRYNSRMNLGIHNLSNFDHQFEYQLPFEKNSRFELYQGYNGNFSHQNQNALDFTMPENTPITAVRDGVVVQVVDVHSKNCGTKECAEFNNFISIYHEDGTFAEYTHITKNGAKVKLGDDVKMGDVVALSGNVGWSRGPHLHLVIYTQNLEDRRTLRTKFKINDGNQTEYLREKQFYLRNY